MNVLILSVGTRNKIVQYFKKELGNKGKVIVTDMSMLAPAIYEADNYYIVPKITDSEYINIILNICKKEKINGVLSLIDPELSILSKNKEKFNKLGVKIIGSSYENCELSLDKMKMYEFCIKNKFKTAKSWNDIFEFKKALSLQEVKFPIFVKPQCGSASVAVSKVNNIETLELLFSNKKEDEKLIIQEFLKGEEIGADVYIDMLSGEVVSIFTKKKIAMRAGETDKAVSFKDEKLFKLIEKFVKLVEYRGQIDIDIFKINEEYYISEVNPRFGGGYPHAYESGINHMKLIINNLNNIINKKEIGNYLEDIYMLKYNEITIKKLKK